MNSALSASAARLPLPGRAHDDVRQSVVALRGRAGAESGALTRATHTSAAQRLGKTLRRRGQPGGRP